MTHSTVRDTPEYCVRGPFPRKITGTTGEKRISVDLQKTLEQFDETETNLCRLEDIWREMKQLPPRDTAFLKDSLDGQRYRELPQEYQAIIDALKVEARFLHDERVDDLGREIQECRARLIQARRELVREHLVLLINVIDEMLERIVERMGPDTDAYDDDEWEDLRDVFDQIQRLIGRIVSRTEHWYDMLRHLSRGQKADLRDIVAMDWPSVRREIESNLSTGTSRNKTSR
jgi:uncharacterized protein YfkK (UPF0435 family)